MEAPAAGFLTLVVVVILIGAIVVGALIWNSSSTSTSLSGSSSGSLTAETYFWTIGNGVDAPFVSSAPIEWPFVVSGNKVSVTYAFTLDHTLTYTNPTLPILLTLPSNATNVVASVPVYGGAVPFPGDTSVSAIQHSPNTIAFLSEPSGNIMTWNTLTATGHNMTFIVFVAYTMA